MPQAKKLIEVVLPLYAINQASEREKPIRHGQHNPSLLLDPLAGGDSIPLEAQRLGMADLLALQTFYSLFCQCNATSFYPCIAEVSSSRLSISLYKHNLDRVW